MALDIRDPLAIRRAGDRYKAITEALKGLDPEAEVDPQSFTLGVREAAKALGHSVREVRALIRQRQLPSRRVGNETRIPLAVVL